MGYLFAILSTALYSFSNIAIKHGMRESSENDNGVYMTIVINVLILGTVWLTYRWLSVHPPLIDWYGCIFFILAGYMTTFFARSMLFAAIKQIGPSRAVAIKNASPTFTIIFALVAMEESIELLPGIGIILILAGLFLEGYRYINGSTTVNHRAGFILALASALGFGVGQGVRKLGILHFPDPFAGGFIGAVTALVCFTGYIIYKNKWCRLFQNHLNFRNKYYIIAGITTSFALLSFFLAIQYTKVSYVATIVATEPILTMLLSKIFLREEDTLPSSFFLSVALIVLGAACIAVS